MFGIGKGNRPEDIKKLRKILNEYFSKKGEERDPENSNSSEVDPDLVFDIQRYQKDNNLKIDGIIHPGGETEKSIQSHPGKPGPDLPVVMPGPGEGQDESCTEISQRLNRSYEEKKELEFKIKGLQSKAEANVSEAKSIKEIAGIASDADVVLKASAGLSGSQLLSKLSAAMGQFVYRLSLLGIGLYTVNAILTQAKVINNDINSYKKQLSDLESEISELQEKAMQLGCKL